MYWRQGVASVLAALGGFYWLAGAGVSGPAALLGALVVGVGARIGLATAARTVWWLRRGTKGIYTEYCPNCRGRRYRGRGDWILTCHRCGWRPGWPGVRWFTRSVPAIQFKRSVQDYRSWAVVPAVVLAIGLLGLFAVSLPLPSASTVQAGLAVVVLVLFAGVVLYYGDFRSVQYCQKCAQKLGKDPPKNCPRCGSNRIKKVDPLDRDG